MLTIHHVVEIHFGVDALSELKIHFGGNSFTQHGQGFSLRVSRVNLSVVCKLTERECERNFSILMIWWIFRLEIEAKGSDHNVSESNAWISPETLKSWLLWKQSHEWTHLLLVSKQSHQLADINDFYFNRNLSDEKRGLITTQVAYRTEEMKTQYLSGLQTHWIAGESRKFFRSTKRIWFAS